MSLSSTDNSMEGVRRNLTSSFDSVSDVKGDTMKVFCRIRPMLSRETEAGYEECIGVLNDEVVRAVVPESSVKFKSTAQEIYEDFKYSVAFGPQVGQFTFFQETITDIITEFVEGQNGLVFSYGITNSGKTYTLQGDESNPGLITLTCHLFFACIEKQLLKELSVRPEKFSDLVVMSASEKSKQLQLKEELFRVCDQESSRTSEATGSKSFGMMLCDAFYDGFKFADRQTTLPPDEMVSAQSALYLKDVVEKSAANQKGFVSIWVSFIEIYNEYIYDLLQPNILQRLKLSLAEDQNGDVYVKGAKEICVSSCEEALKLLELGRKNLRIASTKLNYQSSRSHCIYTLKVVRLFEHAEETCGRINRISFCDLAGSERATKSHATGVRLKEAGYINNSLLVLGRCLDQLRLNQTAREKKMIPYRESKLTRLFYHFFIGKGKAAMIANASPCELTFDETLNVLRFSALAKELTLNDTYVSMASNSIQSLSSQWDQLKSRRDSDCSFDTSAEMDESFNLLVKEKDEIIEKLLDLADGLRGNLKKEKQEKAELEIKLRQEIYEDYSQYSDQLLENQKKVFEEQLELVKYNRQKLHDEMVEFYQEKIRLLEEQFEDENSINESISEKRLSLMEVDQKIASLEKKKDDLVEDSEFQRLVSETESLKSKLSEVEQKAARVDDYSKEIENLKNEIKIYKEKEVAKTDSSDDKSKDVEQSNVDNYVNQINSLTEELQFLKTELEVTKEHLEQKSSKLEKSESDKESSKEQCNNLKSTIDEANQVLDQYKRELEALKLDQITKENELIALNEDKGNLEKELSIIREKLDVENAASHALKSQLEEASKTVDSQKTIIDDSQVKLKDLQSKLRDTVKSLEDIKSKCDVLTAEVCNYQEERAELMEKCSTLENEVNQLKAGFVDQMESSVKEGDLEEVANQKLVIEDLTIKCNSLETDKIELAEKLAKLVESHKQTTEELEIKCSSLETVKIELTAKLDAATEAHAQKIEELENKYNGLETLRKELSEKWNKSALLVESQKQALKEYDIKCNNLETVNMELNARLDEMTKCQKQEIEEIRIKYNNLENVKIELTQKLKESANLIEGQKKAVEELETKCKSLEETLKIKQTSALDESTECQNHEIEELKNNYTSLETVRMELAVKLDEAAQLTENQKLAIEELNTECTNLKSELEVANSLLAGEKIKVEKLSNIVSSTETEISQLNENKAKLLAQLNNVDEDKQAVKSLTSQIELLEKQCCGYKEEKAELINNLQELENQIDVLKESLETESTECKSLRKEIRKLEEDNASYLSELQKSQRLNKKIDEMKEALQASIDENGNIKMELNEIKGQLQSCLEQKGEADLKLEKLKEEFQATLAKNSNLTQELNELQSELKASEQQEQLTKTAESLKAQVELLEKQSLEYTSEKEQLLKQLKELQDKIDVSKEHLDSKSAECETLKKEARRAEKQNESSLSKLQKAEASAKKQVEDLKETLEATLEENAALQKELDELKEKLKSCSMHEEEIEDLRRQVKEKEASIEQLEKGIKDCQKVKKENEAKLENQIEKEKNEDDSSETKHDSSETKTKRAKAGRKQKAPTSKEEVKDSDITTKRRRPLHSKQVKPSVETEDAHENELKEDSKPTRGTRKRKSDDKDFEPVKRSNRRKINEDTSENMSPVQRAISFVGSKFRNVAQSISAPSPRMTRGRKKLFNNESSTSTNPTWKH